MTSQLLNQESNDLPQTKTDSSPLLLAAESQQNPRRTSESPPPPSLGGRSPFRRSTRTPTMTTNNTYPSSSLLISTTDGNTSTHESSHDFNQSTSYYTDLRDQDEDKKSTKTVDKPDNPAKAVFYFVMYTLVSTYCLIAGKFFKTWYPEMSTFQLLFYRGFSAVIIMLFYMNKNTKRLLINEVTVESFPPLAFRIF